MRATARLMAIWLGAMVVLTTALGASAQDPVATEAPSPVCSLLTAQEVSDALGVVVSISNSWDVTCTYDSVDTSGDFFSVSSNLDPKTLAERKLVYTGDTVDVGGHEALYAGDFVPTLFVETPDGGTWTLLVIGTIPDGIDTKAAMTSLGELALSRVGGLDAAATVEPSLAADAELEAFFPDRIARWPVLVVSMTGPELEAVGDVPDALRTALEGADKTLADVDVAIGYSADITANTTAFISAFRVKGVDISTLKDVGLLVLARDKTIGPEVPWEIAGKDVTVTEIDGIQTFLYLHDDILWAVDAIEPALTEIIHNLP